MANFGHFLEAGRTAPPNFSGSTPREIAVLDTKCRPRDDVNQQILSAESQLITLLPAAGYLYHKT